MKFTSVPTSVHRCLLAAVALCGASTPRLASADAPWSPSVASVGRHEIGRTNIDAWSTDFAKSQIALIGDDLVVACSAMPSSCGVGDVFVYRWFEGQGWVRIQSLRELLPADNPGGLYGFGKSLAAGPSASGDWVFVGAPCVDPGGPNGAVFAFRRNNAGTWILARTLYAPALLGNAFGSALAFDGSHLIVGQTGRDEVQSDLVNGGADIFRVDGDELVGPSSISLPFTNGIWGAFAESVALSGDVAVLAGPNVGSVGAVQVGKLAVFARQPNDTWTFESFVESPQAKPYGRFGTSIAMSGDVLAVAAPGESIRMPDGATSEGVVSLFSRVDGGWIARGTIADVPALPMQEGVKSVAMDGEFVLTGAPSQSYGDALGAATLYRLRPANEGGAERVARAARTAEFNAYYDSTGERIALGGGRFAFTRVSEYLELSHRVVRILPVAAAVSDCDGDGVFDGEAILAGDVGDCDDDLVPDACEADCDNDGVADVCAVAPALAFSGTSTPANLGWVVGGVAERVFVTRMTVPDESDGLVRGVASLWSATQGPHGAILALYGDPNQDGAPDDASLLGVWGVEVTIAPGDERITVPPTYVGAPGEHFFVGLAIRRPVGSTGYGPVMWAAAPGPQEAATWTAAFALDEFDPANPFAFGYESLGAEWPGNPNVYCAAMFASPIDADANGEPDSCGCPADLDGDGTVGAGDLAALLGAWGKVGTIDLDGDGIIGPMDLGILLGAWGTCG